MKAIMLMFDSLNRHMLPNYGCDWVKGRNFERLADGAPVHDAILVGTHGRHVHCTDGRYHLMVAPGAEPIYEYTLMPTHMWKMFSPEELALAGMAGPFAFTRGCPLLRIPAGAGDAAGAKSDLRDEEQMETALFDLVVDPHEVNPIADQEIEGHMARLMRENDAPSELFARMGLAGQPAPIS